MCEEESHVNSEQLYQEINQMKEESATPRFFFSEISIDRQIRSGKMTCAKNGTDFQLVD